MIKLEHIYVKYDAVVFDDTNITLNEHQLNVITGASGTGKTTLLSILGLLQKNSHCDYYFDNKILEYKTDKEEYRKYKIGYVFQENYLLKKLTVKENILFSANLSGRKTNKKELENIYTLTKINHLIERNVNSLSGGERQRVAIACALIKKPRLLLLDEPTSFLDKDNAYMIIEILRNITKQTDTIVLLASHDQRIIKYGDVIFSIQNHKIINQNVKIYYENKEVINSIERDIVNTKKAFQSYIKISKKKNKKFIYYCLTIIYAIFFFSTGYKIYYSHYITENFINSSLEEVRVYYGPDKQYAINEIKEKINDNTLSKIKQIEGIKELVPFYEIMADCNDNEILIQTYHTLPDNIHTKYNDGYIYVTYNISKLIENEKIAFSIDDKEYDLEVSGVLTKDSRNKYSKNGEKIIYIKDELLKDILQIDVDPYLYIIIFENGVNLKTVEERIKEIDSYLTCYSTVDIDEICLLNEQLLSGIETLVKIVMIFILIVLIYDKQKYLKERESEFILLYANGMTLKEFHYILYKDSYLYDLGSIFAGNIIAVLLLFIFYVIYINIIVRFIVLDVIIYVLLVIINCILERYIFNHLNFKELT